MAASADEFRSRLPALPTFTFDSDGNFQSGSVLRDNNAGQFWWGNPDTNVGFGANDQGAPMYNACYTWGGAAELREGRQRHQINAYAPEVGTAAGSTRIAT